MLNRLFASRNRPCFKQFSQWDTLNLDLSGCQFSITLPPQDYEFLEERRGTQFNLFDPDFYQYQEEPDRNGHPAHYEGISRPGILKRKWDTYGAVWRERPLGLLQCSSVVCDTSRMKGDLNCFNPEQLERLLLHGSYYSHGPGFGLGEHTAPVNWHIKKLAGTEWVYFESWSRKPKWKENADLHYDAHFSVWMSTPLFKDKYMLLTFSATGSYPAEPSNALMLSRINAIILGLKLRLSSEAEQQKAAALQQNPNARYSANRDPENWHYYQRVREGDFMAGEDPLVFEGPCSPPPKLY